MTGTEADRRLHAQGNPERAAGERANLESDLDFYGVTVSTMRRTVVDVWRRRDGLGHDDLVGGLFPFLPGQHGGTSHDLYSVTSTTASEAGGG